MLLSLIYWLFHRCILVCVKHSRKQIFRSYGAFAYCIQFKAHGWSTPLSWGVCEAALEAEVCGKAKCPEFGSENVYQFHTLLLGCQAVAIRGDSEPFKRGSAIKVCPWRRHWGQVCAFLLLPDIHNGSLVLYYVYTAWLQKLGSWMILATNLWNHHPE